VQIGSGEHGTTILVTVSEKTWPQVVVRRPVSSLAASPALALVAVLLGCLVLLSGCGGPATYRNDTYRFSIDVHRPLQEWRSADTAGGRGFQVAFVDPDGAESGERHLDSLTVTAVTSSVKATVDELPRLRTELGELATKMVDSLGSESASGKPSNVSVGGLPGVVVAYATTIGGRRVVGWQYLLVGSGYTYGLNAGATGSDWNRLRPVFERSIRSFSTD